MKRRFATDFATCLFVLAAPSLARADAAPPLPTPTADAPASPTAPAATLAAPTAPTAASPESSPSVQAPELQAPPPGSASPSPGPSAPASPPGPSAPAASPPPADAAASGQVSAPRPAPPAFTYASPSADGGAETTSGGRHDVRIGAGVRVGYVPTSGFDRFSSNDVLPQLSIDANYALLAGEKFSFALGAAYDVGGVSSDLRGVDTKLTVHRLTVPLEGRFHATRGIFAFLRVAPGAAAFVTSISDSSAPASLDRTAWAFAADASLGSSFLLGPHRSTSKRQVRFWVTPELGYAFTTSPSLRSSPARDTDEAVGTDGKTNLGTLSTSGFFWRVSLALSF